MADKRLWVSSSPHIRSKETVTDIMLDVIIALAPAAVMGTYYFGFRAAAVIGVSVLAAVVSEYLFCLITKRGSSVNDMSAVITGLLLALSLPVSVPLWVPAIGAGFAIIIVKQLFGGLGQNFLNPALGARAFLLAAYPVIMTNWNQTQSGRVFDAFTGATPLGHLRSGGILTAVDLQRAFNGNILGSIGETCAWALLLGFAYLLIRRVISWRIPVLYLLVFSLLVPLFAWMAGRGGSILTGNWLYEVLTGSVLMGAIFMATDYGTSPIAPKGQIIFGAGCGVLHAVFRFYGAFPEGTTYAILLMNICTPLIDRFTRPGFLTRGRGGNGYSQNRF
ncbi:MAG: RnfABCDGE type electron transport complex subunit D [Defluviitaleaceae bacterium]|nr:RnfABCDGE type electron transport complex subunit D [Defluviitaleaceae bacterium]MCL2837034.1 RnfABCDGE type electron transport complex subunit D [Defluviitaleaceae bacterium]